MEHHSALQGEWTTRVIAKWACLVSLARSSHPDEIRVSILSLTGWRRLKFVELSLLSLDLA